LTGVQLEVGSQATSFDFRDYGRELFLCQRYYAKLGSSATNEIVLGGYNTTGNSIYTVIALPAQTRAIPTVALVGTWYTSNCGQPSVQGPGTGSFGLAISPTSTGTCVSASATTYYLTVSAEL
jgi:hypothetical protein